MIGLWQQGCQLYTPITVTQSDTVNLPAVAKFLIVWTADVATPDTIRFTDNTGTTRNITLPLFVAGAAYPICLPFAMTRVHATGTSLEDAEMTGGH